MNWGQVLRTPSVWFFGFTILFLLSLDFWGWYQDDSFLILHLPGWVFYFAGLQLLLSVMLLVFSRTFWTASNLKE